MKDTFFSSQAVNFSQIISIGNLSINNTKNSSTNLFDLFDSAQFGDGMTAVGFELGAASQICLITLYTVTIVLSVVGNLIVICVLTFGSRSRTEVSIFLLNLAVADLFMACFCMPFTFTQTMLGRWIFGRASCPLVLFMQVTSVAVSILTNMAIGVDRFLGVLYPLKRRITRSIARGIVVLIWLASVALASFQLVISRSNVQNYFGYIYMDCREKWASALNRHVYTVVIALCTYFIPLAILAYVYMKIGTALWERQLPGNANTTRDNILLKSKRKVIKLMATLVIVFAICWFPLQTFNLVLDFAPFILDNIKSKRDEQSYMAIYYICHWMAMANSFTNPIIFSFLNGNFRADTEALLARVCRMLRRRREHSPDSPHIRSDLISFRFSKKGSQTTSVKYSNKVSRKENVQDESKPNISEGFIKHQKTKRSCHPLPPESRPLTDSRNKDAGPGRDLLENIQVEVHCPNESFKHLDP